MGRIRSCCCTSPGWSRSARCCSRFRCGPCGSDWSPSHIRDLIGRMAFGVESNPGQGPDVTVPEQFLRTLLAELQDAVVVKDLEGRYLMVNDAAATQLGIAAGEYVGQTDATLFPEHAEAIGENDRAVVETGEPMTVEEPAVVDGELRT